MKRIFFILTILFIAAQLQGQALKSVKATDLAEFIANSKTALIVNMWATWCKPCIEEIPYFLEEINKHNSSKKLEDRIELLLVSLDFPEDYPERISLFAERRKIAAPIVWLDETNADYFCPQIDKKWDGAIPATLFINNKTGYRNFFDAQISRDTLKKEIMAMLANAK